MKSNTKHTNQDFILFYFVWKTTFAGQEYTKGSQKNRTKINK